MSTNKIFFCVEIRNILSLSSGAVYNKNHLGLVKNGLSSGVVLFSSGLNSRILLYTSIYTIPY